MSGPDGFQWNSAVCPHPSHLKNERNFGRDPMEMCLNIKIPMLLLLAKNDDKELRPIVTGNSNNDNGNGSFSYVEIGRAHV